MSTANLRPPGGRARLAARSSSRCSPRPLGLWRRGRGQQPPAGAPETSTPSPAADDQETSPADGTPIRITFGDTELTARLDDNATARDLAAQLPLTLTFRDHNNVEKTAPLPRELSLEGARRARSRRRRHRLLGARRRLVFYYDSDAPFFNGIVRIGEFDGEMDAIERQSQDFTVTIERG